MDKYCADCDCLIGQETLRGSIMEKQIFRSHVISGVIDSLAASAHVTALQHGFYNDQLTVMDMIDTALLLPGITSTEQLAFGSAKVWLQSSAEQAAIARMHSELSEWLETVRKDRGKADEHCPEFLSAEIEAADVLIRVFDTCGQRGYRLGAAVLVKMEYNRTRPYKHGKNS